MIAQPEPGGPSETGERRGKPALELAWVIASAVLVVAVTWRHMDLLGDSFFYIASGDWVLDKGALPETDPLAFTSVHGPWLLHFPAAQIAFAWIARHLGLMVLLAVTTVVSAASGLVLWLAVDGSLVARAVGLCVLVGFIELGSDDLSARGQVFGDLAFAVLLLCMLRLKRGERVAWWIPVVLGATWINFHPSVLLAIGFPILIAATLLLDPASERPSLRPFAIFNAVALVATGLNPYSYVLLVDIARLATAKTTPTVDLFQSPNFHSPAWLVTVASAAGLLLVRARWGGVTQRRSDVALLALFLFAACSARRFGSLLGAVELVTAMHVATRVRLEPLRRSSAKLLLVVAIAAELAVSATLFAEPKDPFAHVPREATAFIVDHGLPERVFNPYHWGGYLDAAWHRRRKVFIDGRINLFSNGTSDDAITIEAGVPASLELLDIYEIRTLLVERDSPLDALLARDADYRRVFVERLAAVYVRR